VDPVTVLLGAVDIPFVLAVVAIIEVTKRTLWPRAPKAVWTLALFFAGFGAAALKVPVVHANWKSFGTQGIIYAGAAELVYFLYSNALKARRAKK
jgi:ABC-type Na+ efflux pump permease subunit